MKGFLHRIAASTLRHQPSLHPFVESIYAPARAQEFAAPRMEHEAIVSAAAPAEPAARSVLLQPPTPPAQPSSAPPLAPVKAWKQEPTEIAERESYQPMLAPQNADAGMPATRAQFHEGPRETQEGDKWLPEADGSSSPRRVAAAMPPTEPKRDASPPSLESLPMVMERLFRSEAPESAKPAPTPAVAQAAAAMAVTAGTPSSTALTARAARVQPTRRPAQNPQGSRPAPAESDDIQIHIGRIEVLAVPQAAPRPAAAPARKGMSLDEYLSRRNGRSG